MWAVDSRTKTTTPIEEEEANFKFDDESVGSDSTVEAIDFDEYEEFYEEKEITDADRKKWPEIDYSRYCPHKQADALWAFKTLE